MPSNSEALKALEQSATEQKKQLESTVAEIHKESLVLLSKDLVNLHNTKLTNLTNSIRKEISESLEKSLQSKTWLIVSLTALVVLIIAIPATWYLKPKEIVTQTQTLTKEVEDTTAINKLQAEKKDLIAQVNKLQAENKSLKEWSVPEKKRGFTDDGKKRWILTREIIDNDGKKWALFEN